MRTLHLLAFFLICQSLFAGSSLNPDTTIVNNYTAALEYDGCTNAIIIADASAFKVGDTVLLIQMKGAAVDSSMSSRFGDIIQYGNAGNYEYGYVKSVTGNSVVLQNTLLNSYDYSFGKVQMIRVPYFQNITTNDIWSCKPWDGTVGGVLAFNVQNTLTLNNDIDVSGRGFSGGRSPNPNTTTLYCNYNNYYYPKGTQGAAEKGEGVSFVTDGKLWGKGKLANGGGGGNGHNSGGGGGANGGKGGFGGYQLEACGGSATDNRGIGGEALQYSTANNKVFLGGGGGSGHTDNNGGSDMKGGNGGGIILISANTVAGNGHSILSNGQDAEQCGLSPIDLCHDASAGGGAGGSILISAASYSSPVNAVAKGGKGGDLVVYYLPNAGRIGPGAGGGGGVVWVSNPSKPGNFSLDLAGGKNGVIVPKSNDPYGTTPGDAGQILYDLELPIGSSLFTSNCNNQVQIINEYAEVTNWNPCDNILGISDASKFNVGDTVLIIQMKGATVDSSNTNLFGDIGNLNNAGNYEYNTIAKINGNQVALRYNLEKRYDVPFGFVQLVRVPSYQDVTFNETLSCKPWDGSSGGILVLNVYGTLSLNNGINVSEKGFRGGDGTHPSLPVYDCDQNDYYYPPNSELGAGKGEGIAVLSADKSTGKGKLANGGGGGNSHNSGGGGGGNYAQGGYGGYQFEGSPCNTTVPFDNRGLGGKNLPYSNAQNKIFLGGGGGAGHANNPENFTPNGGNGGGICIIAAARLSGPNTAILADGQQGQACLGFGATGCHEGMGGGGAGGTVLLAVGTYPNPTTISVRGGNGADMVQAGNLRVGPGGGGSAGIVWFANNAVPPNTILDLSGGRNGTATEYSGDNWGATAGGAGKALFGLRPTVDTVLFSSPIDTLSMQILSNTCTTLSFEGKVQSNSPISTWSWDFGDGAFDTTQNATHDYGVAGNFNVKLAVADANNCKDSITVPVKTSVLNLQLSADTTVCDQSSVQLNASGGTTYSWTPAGSLNNAKVSNPVASPAATTTYVVNASNDAGCSGSDSVTVTLSTPPALTVSGDTTICAGATINLQATGGNTYSWSPSAGLSNPSSANTDARPVTTTTYVVTAANDAGCRSTDSLSIAVNPNPLISASNDTTICGDVSLSLFATGGQKYSWSPAASLNDPKSSNPVATPTSTTLYQVTGIDNNNCSGQDSVLVTVISAGQFAVSPPTAVCSGQSTQLSASGGDTYIWSPAQSLDNTNASNPVAKPDSTTIYTVIIRNSQCNVGDTLTTQVEVSPSLMVTARSSNNIDCIQRSSQLNVTGAASYIWSPATGLSATTIGSPIATPGVTTTYTVQGFDSNGCSGQDSVTVSVNFTGNAGLYLLPNSFTPNGDGLNECFGAKSWGTVSNFDLRIYNRYGEMVFHSTEASKCWDGYYKQKLQDPGVFVYLVKGEAPCGNINTKGVVTLIR